MMETTSAQRYRAIRNQARVRERPLIPLPKIPSELELQARWFAGDFGRDFETAAGEKLEIVQFGFWNHETGPDFQHAAIRLNETETRHGPIEIDLIDRNWELHGHATNPAFDETILHVFLQESSAQFFTRTSKHRNVTQLKLDPRKLQKGLGAEPALAHAGRCVAPLKNLEAARIASILEGAAQFRLNHKAVQMRQRIEVHGRDEALYQAIADALGYKQNRLPFTLLAQRLPLTWLSKHTEDAEAMLFGVAGFLKAPEFTAVRPTTRSYMRSLWDKWWKYREQYARLTIPEQLWKMGGGRPFNHPHRRLGALATLIQHWRKFSNLVSRNGDVAKFLSSLQHSFWSNHFTLAADAATKPQALIGKSRIVEILANVIYPLAIVRGRAIWEIYRKLPAQLSNQSVRIAAARLFADDERQREFLRAVAGQQGLLQIYEDFCLRDASDCADCPFPEQLRKW